MQKINKMNNEDLQKVIQVIHDVVLEYKNWTINKSSIAYIQDAIKFKLLDLYANGDLGGIPAIKIFCNIGLLNALRPYMLEREYAINLDILEKSDSRYTLQIMEQSQYEQYVKDLVGNNAEQFLKENK